MTKISQSFLPTLPITKQYYPEQNQNTLCKIIKLAAFLLALPFLLLADLLYAAFYARRPVQIIENPLPAPSSLPKPDPSPPTIDEALIEPMPSSEPILIEIPATEDPISEPPIVPRAPDTPEPEAPVDPIVLPPEKPSLLARAAPLALGLLGFGTLAYLLRSYGQTSLPPENDFLNSQPSSQKETSHSNSITKGKDDDLPIERPLETKTPLYHFDPKTLSNQLFGQCPTNPMAEMDYVQKLSILESLAKAPTSSTAAADPLNPGESLTPHVNPEMSRKLSFDQCPIISRNEIGPSQSISIYQSQHPSLPPRLVPHPELKNLNDLACTNTPPPLNPPPSSTPDWLWGLGAAAIATAGFTLWNLIRGEDQAGLEGVPDEGALPSQRNQQPIDPLPPYIPESGHDYPVSRGLFSPDPSSSSEEEVNKSSPPRSTEIVPTIDALANLTPGPDGRISIRLNHHGITKLFLDANDLKDILWAVNLNDLSILERPFPCEIERTNECGERERLPNCTVTPLDLLQNLSQSRSLSSGSGSSSEAPDPKIAKWTEYLSQVSAPFCSFDLSDDRDFSTMYVRPKILINALENGTSHFKCGLKPRNSHEGSDATQMQLIYSRDLQKEVAVVEYELKSFLSNFTPPSRNQFAFSHGESSNAAAKNEFFPPPIDDSSKIRSKDWIRQKQLYLEILQEVQNGNRTLDDYLHDRGLSYATFLKWDREYGIYKKKH